MQSREPGGWIRCPTSTDGLQLFNVGSSCHLILQDRWDICTGLVDVMQDEESPHSFWWSNWMPTGILHNTQNSFRHLLLGYWTLALERLIISRFINCTECISTDWTKLPHWCLNLDVLTSYRISCPSRIKWPKYGYPTWTCGCCCRRGRVSQQCCVFSVKPMQLLQTCWGVSEGVRHLYFSHPCP